MDYQTYLYTVTLVKWPAKAMKKCRIVFECNWIELPQQLQKCFIIMFSNAQQPLYYDGFGVAVLNLQTFIKVTD